MKIVKFKDGRYGVRKCTFNPFCWYAYLGRGSWWITPEYVDRYCKGTIGAAASAMNLEKHRKREPRFDAGVPVSFEQVEQESRDD